MENGEWSTVEACIPNSNDCHLPDITNNIFMNEKNVDIGNLNCIESKVAPDRCGISSTVQYFCRDEMLFEDTLKSKTYFLLPIKHMLQKYS